MTLCRTLLPRVERWDADRLHVSSREIVLRQAELQRSLSALVNGVTGSTAEALARLCCPKLGWRKRAARLVQMHASFAALIPQNESARIHVQASNYQGKNTFVRRMIAFLNHYAADDLYGAYVHGSLATGEETAYSDFDALVIIRNSVMRNAERLTTLARELNRARQIMLEYDPFQHHGWFVLTEADLDFHCEAWFPHQLFEFSKSMLADRGLQIEITPRESSTEVRETFRGVATGLKRSIFARRPLKNMYHLKNTLSLFMLLPALYLHVRDGRGMFKKFTFAVAREDFSHDEWSCMDRVSDIRARWNYKLAPLIRKVLRYPSPLRRRLVRRCAPSVPLDIQRLATDKLLIDMCRLARRMSEKLGLQ